MIYPWNLDKKDYDILFWSEPRRSTRYLGDKIDPAKIEVEPEIAVFHKEGKPVCLGIQGHPEIMERCELHELLNNLILQYGRF